jgi:hypothetical protein
VEDDGLCADELTEVLKVAFSQHNRFGAALTGAVGALDRIVEKAPGGELTGGLSCAAWLRQKKPDQGWRLERLPDGRRIVYPPRRPGPVWGPAIHAPPPSSGGVRK